MMKRIALALAAGLLAGPAFAAAPPECLLAQHQIEHNFPLPNSARAVAAKRLTILVVGSGSSTLPGKGGAERAYPARLQAALSETLPGVAVKVVADAKARRTASAMLAALKQQLTAVKPALMIWQTGTVDAIQSVDPDRFNDALETGVLAARKAGADVVLVNGQYSPRTESMIALGRYAEDMRWVALQYGAPLFNRYEIMRLWADLGTFELARSVNKLDTARRVHSCLGWLLADLITEGVKPDASPGEGSR
jgi:hypothetical protein